MCTFKNLEEIWKTRKKFEKTSGNPDKKLHSLYFIVTELNKDMQTIFLDMFNCLI